MVNKLSEDIGKYLKQLTPAQSSLKGAELLRKCQSKLAQYEEAEKEREARSSAAFSALLKKQY